MNRYKHYSLGLIGHPLEHSLSLDLHQLPLNAMDIQGEYKLFPNPPLPEGTDSLAGMMERVRQGVLHGINVTIPHKQNVLNFLSHLTPLARAIGAVNTVFSFNGEWIGDNTDAPAFLIDLERFAQNEFETYICGQDHKSDPQRALVLGAGGSARVVAYTLLDAGLKATSGLSMLVEQAELALERWNEAPAPRGPMWASVPEFDLHTPTNRGLK